MNDFDPGFSTLPSQQGRKARAIAATGRVHFLQTASLWIGTGRGRSEWHQHHAHQLALALEGEFRFRPDTTGPWTVFEAAFIPSNCPHEFELDQVAVAHLFVEPESAEGRALARQFPAGEISALPETAARTSAAALLPAYRSNVDAERMKATARSALATLVGGQAGSVADPEVDSRLVRALGHIRERVRGPVSLAEAAAAAALSPSRFRHLFVQETGTSFRAYVLWLRINVAIEAAMGGASWTEAAHEAGFTDSSHLTRTHRRMFGIEPTAIRQR